jgi:hypothetical protein
MLVFDGFPGDFFFYSLEGVAAFSIIALLFGYYTRLASLLTGISLLVGYGFLYSLGKVNHNILVLIIPLFMAGSNWGSRLSLDALHGRVPDRESTGWPIALIAASPAVAMFIAGAGKVIGGWFDPSLQATQPHLVHQFFANERQDLLAPHLLSISNGVFWELQDWATVVLEIGFLGAVLRLTWLRAFMIAATFFHLGVALSMNILFVQQILVYALFVEWSQFLSDNNESGLTTSIFESQEIGVGLMSIVAVIYYVTGPPLLFVNDWIQFKSGMDIVGFAVIVAGPLFAAMLLARFLVQYFQISS